MTTTPESPLTQAANASKRDLRALLERFKLPGVDTQALLESGRKDIETLLETNERVFVAAEALAHKQAEMLSELAKEWQAGLKDSISKAGGAEKLSQASGHAERAFSVALSGMKDMAEITAKSNQDVLTILNTRFHEALKELRSSLRGAAASATPTPPDAKG